MYYYYYHEEGHNADKTQGLDILNPYLRQQTDIVDDPMENQTLQRMSAQQRRMARNHPNSETRNRQTPLGGK
jgi:hypothetical protein